jgi:hypothetical protein
MVVAKQAAKPIPAGDFSLATPDLNARLNDPILQRSVIAFRMCNKQLRAHGT